MGANTNAPIIIKRKKVIAGGGHHGGAWKVAYADFVTAMMAFFLLMWLLNATTEQQRKGLADYFTPEIPVARVSGGGTGNFGGESLTSEDMLALMGRGASALNPTEEREAKGALHEVEVSLKKALEAPENIEMRAHFEFRMTDEGPAFDLHDTDQARLYDPGSDIPTPLMRMMLRVVSQAAAPTGARLAIEGHMASVPMVLKDSPVWDLSLARAAKAREILESAGLDGDRLMRVTGHADHEPTHPEVPLDVRNNRIQIILLQEPPPVPLVRH